MGKTICPHCLRGRISLGKCNHCKKEVIVMGKIANIYTEFHSKAERDALDEAIKYAQEKGQTTVHVGRFIQLDEALAIQKLLKDSPLEEE